MENFAGKLAVVTGGGTGMGRELVIQLAAAGADVATCDVNADTLSETQKLAQEAAPSSDQKITTHICDVSDEAAMQVFRDEVVRDHGRDYVNLVFNNAGVGGTYSFVDGDRAGWERTFNICWGGVYNGCRTFIPLLVKSDDGYLINTSSVNGFYASIGVGVPHTAYSAAKFAVKGLTEALIEDFRTNAPHVKVAVVMPGHIGTDIVKNSRGILGGQADTQAMRDTMAKRGIDTSGMSDDDIANITLMMAEGFKNNAPTTAAQAATIILDGVRAGKWRILVGADAERLDEAVRANPEHAYDDGMPMFSLISSATGQ